LIAVLAVGGNDVALIQLALRVVFKLEAKTGQKPPAGARTFQCVALRP
jgi:hypothetical protein